MIKQPEVIQFQEELASWQMINNDQWEEQTVGETQCYCEPFYFII